MSSSKTIKSNRTIRQITLAAMLVSILYGQELILSSIPNVQLTVVLIMVYAAALPLSMSIPIVTSYVFLDNLLFGSFSLLYTPGMFLAWITLTLVSKALANKKFVWTLVFATIFGVIYGWFYIPGKFIEQGIFNLKAYLIADLIPFGIILTINNFVTVFLMYRYLRKLLASLYQPESNQLA
jgi:hypothetical protein